MDSDLIALVTCSLCGDRIVQWGERIDHVPDKNVCCYSFEPGQHAGPGPVYRDGPYLNRRSGEDYDRLHAQILWRTEIHTCRDLFASTEVWSETHCGSGQMV